MLHVFPAVGTAHSVEAELILWSIPPCWRQEKWTACTPEQTAIFLAAGGVARMRLELRSLASDDRKLASLRLDRLLDDLEYMRSAIVLKEPQRLIVAGSEIYDEAELAFRCFRMMSSVSTGTARAGFEAALAAFPPAGHRASLPPSRVG